MTYERERDHRRSIRLLGYDYAQAGAYFVTICAFRRQCLFGEVAGDEVRLSPIGPVVLGCWDAIPGHFPAVELDAAVVMPNHLHGVLVIAAVDGATATGGYRGGEGFGRPMAGSVPTIVRSFKAAVSREVNRTAEGPGTPIWQRNYYERVIRDERELDRIRASIEANPARWAEDADNPIRSVPTRPPDSPASR